MIFFIYDLKKYYVHDTPLVKTRVKTTIIFISSANTLALSYECFRIESTDCYEIECTNIFDLTTQKFGGINDWPK